MVMVEVRGDDQLEALRSVRGGLVSQIVHKRKVSINVLCLVSCRVTSCHIDIDGL